jgi:hypothetical protein
MFLVFKRNGFSGRTSWFLLFFASIVASIILVACGHTAKSGNTCDGTKTGVKIENRDYVVTYHAGLLGLDPFPYYDASPTQPATMTTITDNQGNDVLQFQTPSNGLWDVTVKWSGCMMQLSSPVKEGGT